MDTKGLCFSHDGLKDGGKGYADEKYWWWVHMAHKAKSKRGGKGG